MKDKIIELSNGEKYVVADEVNYANRTFLMLGKVILETEEIEELEIYEKIDNNVEKVLDEELIDNLIKIFEMNLPEIN